MWGKKLIKTHTGLQIGGEAQLIFIFTLQHIAAVKYSWVKHEISTKYHTHVLLGSNTFQAQKRLYICEGESNVERGWVRGRK